MDHSPDFEILDHPADIGFRVKASSLDQLFESAGLALIALIYDPVNAMALDEFEVVVEGGDLESLLVNWLNEILYWADSRRVAVAKIRVMQITGSCVRAVCGGEPRDPDKHPARLIVKAVTYHELQVAQSAAGWTAEVYVDV